MRIGKSLFLIEGEFSVSAIAWFTVVSNDNTWQTQFHQQWLNIQQFLQYGMNLKPLVGKEAPVVD